MAHVGLVSCASKKHLSAANAECLYTSALFTKSRAFVKQNCDSWFILSAKYGLVEPAEIIEPYEETLNTKSRPERMKWADKVWAALRQRIKPKDRVTILAGERYREYLTPFMTEYGCIVEVPMQGVGIGRQMQWLTHQLQHPHQNVDVERLYQALNRLESGLGGKRLMSECIGQRGWPNSGVYMFFEPSELRANNSVVEGVQKRWRGELVAAV